MTAPPAVTVVGYSNAGKTRCVVKLISALTRRGYRVASVKHCHQGFDLDVKGKDSWKHKQAGAIETIMSSRNRIGLISDTTLPLTLKEICQRYIHDADLVLAEGFSWEPFPQILVVSAERLEQERVALSDALFALVAEKRFDTSIPQFSFAELDQLALLLERRFLIPQQLISQHGGDLQCEPSTITQ